MSYDSDVINATSGRGEANWDQIIKLCNRIRDSVGPTSMAQAMGSVLKRVKHSDPNVQLHSLTLLEACVSNCGKSFQEELTKAAFQNEFKSIIAGSYADPRVTQRCKDLVVSWANEFKTDPNLRGLVRFVEQLRKDGISFQGLPVQQQQQQQQQQQPNVHQVSNEDVDLRRAIEMSLRDSNSAPAPSTTVTPTSHNLYPSMPKQHSTPISAVQKDAKKVRAIYDFVAAEDNELSFRAGEIITVVDHSDENWWKGQTQLGTGLFPASFVSANLSADPEPSQHETKDSKKGKSGRNKSEGKKGGGKGKGCGKVAINVEKIDLLLDMIKGADVTSEDNLAENETILELEDECKKMRPLLESTMAGLQKKEEDMHDINQKFEDALGLYRKLLAEGPRLGSAINPQHPTKPNPGMAPSSFAAPPISSHPNSNQYSPSQPPYSNTLSTINNNLHQHHNHLPPPPYFPTTVANDPMLTTLYPVGSSDIQSGPTSLQQQQLKEFNSTSHMEHGVPPSGSGSGFQVHPQSALGSGGGQMMGISPIMSRGSDVMTQLLPQQTYSSHTSLYQPPSNHPLL